MAPVDAKNPLTWYLVQIVEYLVIIAVLGRVVPDSTPRWLQVALFVVVIVGVFVLNYFVVMPKIGRSSRSQRDEPEG
jgi:Mn2+/Fe2+ NRAMP family transporter